MTVCLRVWCSFASTWLLALTGGQIGALGVGVAVDNCCWLSISLAECRVLKREAGLDPLDKPLDVPFNHCSASEMHALPKPPIHPHLCFPVLAGLPLNAEVDGPWLHLHCSDMVACCSTRARSASAQCA